ncbi:MAG TPA: cobalamin-independent methionine synthase II family protein [Caulobacteraceae bacterium]|nr:cobalamin-independent methionine synthase II family protein [Caulobacteraceae bacterium]
MAADRILTTHAGSLPRPAALRELHERRFAGERVDEAAFAAETKAAVADVVARQAAAGIDIANDGEAGRESFFTFVRERFTGFGGRSQRPPMADMVRYPGFLDILQRMYPRGGVSLGAPPQAIGEVKHRGEGEIEAECARLKAAIAAAGDPFVGAFMTAPSPGIIAAAMQNVHYASLADYVAAVGEALAPEYRAILEAGLILQIDAPDLAMERHTLFAGKPLADFLDFVRLVLDAIGRALADAPSERVRLHVCWGNYEGPHDLDVPLADIWPQISGAPVGGFLISMANPRHAHEVGCFSGGALPAGATLVAGVIDTTTNYVEHPEVVAERLERAVAAVGDPARVMAGTDCGFETAAGFQSVAADVCWAKLAAMSEGARIASGRVF